MRTPSEEQRGLWSHIHCFERLVESSGDLVVSSDTNGRTLSWSQRAQDVLG
jgi:hypothetical protein